MTIKEYAQKVWEMRQAHANYRNVAKNPLSRKSTREAKLELVKAATQEVDRLTSEILGIPFINNPNNKP
jgi:hypothetical protein